MLGLKGFGLSFDTVGSWDNWAVFPVDIVVVY